jgi:PhzF family phenazine biosynthesis protein
MPLPIYQIDAFTSHRFQGNPAAVVVLDRWLEQELMQAIAAENNLAETAFICEDVSDGDFGIRWFTPCQEVDLCGHATLASAWVLYRKMQWQAPAIRFQSRSGELMVTREGQGLALDFPARPPVDAALPIGLLDALGVKQTVYTGQARDWLVVLESEQEVARLQPDFGALLSCTSQAVIVTARGEECDFVSRFFAPGVGINEDPVTGSAHCTLVPYWADQLDKSELFGRQISARQGELRCRLTPAEAQFRVMMWGEAVLYLEGTIEVG